MKRNFYFILFALLSCAPRPVLPPVVKTLAVLPFDNEANDVDAGDIMQRLVYLALKPSDYDVIDIEEVNSKLKEKGIVDGGQLAAVDPTKVGEDLGVQGLVFGYVENFGYTNIGVYVSRKVTLQLKVLDVTTKSVLWENTATGATREFALNEQDIKKNFAKGLADQLTDKIFKTPLEEEAKLAVRKVLYSLPGFQFRGFAKDENTPSHLKSDVKKGIKQFIKDK